MTGKNREIIIGTRGSDLALTQATTTEALFGEKFPGFSFVRKVIKTTGDRRTDVSLAEVAKAEGTFDKGVFIKELEEALADESIHIAVHSLKDMPTVLESRFALAATLERAPVKDVLLSKTDGGIDGLPEGARVGTSSVRRAKQIEFLRPDLKVLDLRGNVPTRIKKLADEDDYDAILLAEAGLVRLGYLPVECVDSQEKIGGEDGVFAHRLPEEIFFPAAGQGAIGLEIRAGDEKSLELCRSINHELTWLKVTAEREFLRLLDGGCHTPVGVYSTVNGGEITLYARVFPDEGGTPRIGQATGIDPIKTAFELFNSLK
ncbi:hydroxymethylbilane synthase [Luteolibacter sp. AS25]|uniref:hydroxymethylbilane synthase n=1 Tax=Luteolibacter sp. AS25 TaxID=3135776 RepID=UPI00398B0B85